MPHQVARMHKNILMSTLLIAFINKPSCNKNNVSNEKVENVVKAPKKPTMIKARTSDPNVNFSVSRTKAIPIKKDPKILTLSVP